MDLNKDSKDRISLFYFLGWRIWKQNNDMIFQSKRWFIPNVINKNIVDGKVWLEASDRNCVNFPLARDSSYQNNGSSQNNVLSNVQHAIFQAIYYCCLVDASWTSSTQNAGLAWTS